MDFTLTVALDIFLRCAAAGQLLLLCVIYLHRPLMGQKLALLAVAVCTIGYLLLTAPIPDEHYGFLRNILLLLTDSLAYAVWLAGAYYFNDDFTLRRWPLAVKVGVALLLLWNLLFFVVLGGIGSYHQINHAISAVLFAHVIYMVLKDLNADLVDRRRASRIVIAVLTSVYGLYLAVTEIGGFHQGWLLSLFDASFILLSVMVLSRLLLSSVGLTGVSTARQPASLARNEPQPLPPGRAASNLKLNEFIDNNGYRQSNLTIKTLAEQLSCPEHHLRQLINSGLGYRNFNAFLNDLRIRDARQQLTDPAKINTPVLTIALDLGYGSIGPFNRAFKAETGQTPREYRLSS